MVCTIGLGPDFDLLWVLFSGDSICIIAVVLMCNLTYCARFKPKVHLESRLNDNKQRFIRVSFPQTEEDLRHMEEERKQAEQV